MPVQSHKMAQLSRRVARAVARRLEAYGGGPIGAEKSDAAMPYEFNAERYRNSFLTRSAPTTAPDAQVPRRVFALWTGSNTMSETRRGCLRALQETIGVPLVLVTEENLGSWVVDKSPLHPAYAHLSLVHKSDYLRAYLMHHHGGGYTDIKRPTNSWTAAFELANNDAETWLVGCREQAESHVAEAPGAEGLDTKLHYRKLATCCSMIGRAHSPFTAEWMRELDRRLDYYGPHLSEIDGGILGDKFDYPIPWTNILGGIYHPLQLKYQDNIRFDASLYLHYEDYR